MAKYVCVCMVCMNVVCIGKGMDFPLVCQNERALRLMALFRVLNINQYEDWDDTIDIYRVKNSCMFIVVFVYQRRNRLSHHWKFDEPFGAWFHFLLKDFFLGTMSGGMEVVFLVKHSG